MKEALRRPPVLAAYDVSRPAIVSADASEHGVGVVLTQIQEDGTRRLVAAASRSLTDAEKHYAVIEKEALAVTWALEKFSRYVLGLADLKVETDHKPLVQLLGMQELAKLPARIMRFRLRLMKYSFTISHVPGKENVSADALSRYPAGGPNAAEVAQVEQTESFVSRLVQLPATDVRQAKFLRAQCEDEVLSQVGKYVDGGWPAYLSSTDSMIKPYYEERAFLTRYKGMLVHRNRVVVPQTERLTTLRQIHEGHLGINKCVERAKKAVWWPHMRGAIHTMVRDCPTCKRNSPVETEPLRPTETPERPWQVVGSDLFQQQGKTYLLVTDYYSRYPEVALLTSESASEVIRNLKSIFARHGIPEMLISDNGPAYAAHEFKSFADTYKFRSVTSSPRYPRANGAAERMVRTVKNILAKSEDPQLGLLAYRTSPIHGGFSPAELLMAAHRGPLLGRFLVRLRQTTRPFRRPMTSTRQR